LKNLFHNKQHPAEMGKTELEGCLAHLAIDQHVSASTQNQALSAILFLYIYVLDTAFESINALLAKNPKHLPEVHAPAAAQPASIT
jgi:site-specific recombinase XerD